MRLTFCLSICILQIFCYAKAKTGAFTIMTPLTIHSNGIYMAEVAAHRSSQTCKIKVGITGPSYNESQLVEVWQNGVQHVEFDLPSLSKGDYNVTAESVYCKKKFNITTKLIYNKFHNHVRVQTDKGLYKPGDEVNFRVIFIDKDFKPAEPNQDAVIWFKDPKFNRVKEIKNFNTTNGVFASKFKISDFPIMGYWRLGVKNGDGYDSVIFFEVDKYILPKYVVSVEVPSAVSIKDGDMQVIVRANCTYGTPLDGKVTVQLSRGDYYYVKSEVDERAEGKESPVLIKSADMVKGKAKIDFNVKEFDGYLLSKSTASFLLVDVTVEEQFTGVKINGSASTEIYPYRYEMQCYSYETCIAFEEDKESDVVLRINSIDGSNLNDTKSTVELIYKEVLEENDDDSKTATTTTTAPPKSEDRIISFKGHMNETGFATFKVLLPPLEEYKNYSHFYTMELKYLDEQREVSTTHQKRKPNKIQESEESEEDEKPVYIYL